MPKNSANNIRAVPECDDDPSVQEYSETSISEYSIPGYAREESEQSVIELDDESNTPGEEESVNRNVHANHWDEEGMSSIPESGSQINDDEHGQVLLPEDSADDPELLYFIKNGRFEDDLVIGQSLAKDLIDGFRLSDHNVNEVSKIINNEINEMTLRTNEEKENLKTAIREVMLQKRSRKEAVVEHNVDWCLFTTTISRVYGQLELSNYGVAKKGIPEFDLNLLEIYLDKGEKTDTNVDGDHSTSTGPSKKKFKASTDASSHATFNRRLGDCVPEHWRGQHADLVRFCIRKSVDMTMSLKADRNDLEGTLNKCKAIENVILENGNAKTAAINFGINYSTLHNYTHRAMVTVAKVMGNEEIPEKTQQLLKKRVSFEDICKAMEVKRAPTLARFVKTEQKES